VDTIFQAVHRNDPDPQLLAFFVIPSEVTSALGGISSAFAGNTEASRKEFG
jgi:hypothetical protein